LGVAEGDVVGVGEGAIAGSGMEACGIAEFVATVPGASNAGASETASPE